LLYPWALLLGNSGKCFECSHQHGVGDRCISVRLREDLFEEIAASAAATSRFRFSAPNLPPSAKLLPIVALLEALSLHTSPSRTEELAIRLVEGLIGAMADSGLRLAPPAHARPVVSPRRFASSSPTSRDPSSFRIWPRSPE
jgi:AraC family transcriptional regulator